MDLDLCIYGMQMLLVPYIFCDRKQFVQAYVDHILNKSVEDVFKEFKRGFYKVCDKDVVQFFQPEELRGVMVGKEDYDWDTLREVKPLIPFTVTLKMLNPLQVGLLQPFIFLLFGNIPLV